MGNNSSFGTKGLFRGMKWGITKIHLERVEGFQTTVPNQKTALQILNICIPNSLKMEAFQIARRKNNIQVTIGKKDVDSDALMEILRRIQIEFLAQRVNFDDCILELAKEINSDWWQKKQKPPVRDCARIKHPICFIFLYHSALSKSLLYKA